MHLSRRGFLKALGIGAGAAVAVGVGVPKGVPVADELPVIVDAVRDPHIPGRTYTITTTASPDTYMWTLPEGVTFFTSNFTSPEPQWIGYLDVRQ